MLPSSHGHRGSSSAMPGFVVRVIIELGILAFIVVSYEAHRNQHGVNPLAGAADVHALAERLETWKGHAGPADAPALQRLIQELKDLQGAKQTVAALRGEAKKPCKQEAKKTEAAVATAAAVEASSQAWEEKTFYALSIAGTQCHQAHHADLWGDPVIWGGEHHTATASECCAACQAHRQAAMRGGLNKGPNSTFCNVWVHCGDKARCGGMYQECWLKHQRLPKPPAQPDGSRGDAVGWTGGVIYDEQDEYVGGDGVAIMLHTKHGDLRLDLLPDLGPKSVRELRRMVARLPQPGGVCDGCKFYRSEKGFLLQGVIRAPGHYVETPRRDAPPQRKVMQRGLACWAGGEGGPDFFINHIDQSGFGDSHLCFGLIKDMTLVDRILELPLKPKAKPSDMTFLAEPVTFNMTLLKA